MPRFFLGAEVSELCRALATIPTFSWVALLSLAKPIGLNQAVEPKRSTGVVAGAPLSSDPSFPGERRQLPCHRMRPLQSHSMTFCLMLPARPERNPKGPTLTDNQQKTQAPMTMDLRGGDDDGEEWCCDCCECCCETDILCIGACCACLFWCCRPKSRR
ncbi:hypothetical protein B0T24DRAFT_612833 [Lasiosphaeria ovina]|uniref:Uncharacterized protein n=1 Tax=Lasiosphaeria ovina TaxID=92902 RepID=A0AAE0NDV9_9PEZI|nr:hypothetical protein B0T24DRAFT_612833 [Lasiosphaeria ovina]